MKRTVVNSDLVNREIGYLVSEEGGSRKVTSSTISDMNTWMYWSSLLYGRVMNFSL